MNEKEINCDPLDKSIISDELSKISSEIIESSIDSFLSDGILKEIPIVGTIVSVTKIGIAIREKLFVKKILKFLFELKDIPLNKRIKFITEINSKSEYSSKVGEAILIILDHVDDLKKAELIGRLFSHSINGKINYETFLRLSSIIERCFLPDLNKLRTFYNGEQGSIEDFDNHLLYNLGLLRNLGISGKTHLDPHNEKRKQIEFKISEYGRLIVELLLIDNKNGT